MGMLRGFALAAGVAARSAIVRVRRAASTNGRLNARWHNAPVVTVNKAAMPKPVTFVYPYYCNAGFLRRQIEGWLQFPAELRRHLSAIVVDDGTPEPELAAEDVLRDLPRPFPIQLFRIEVDVRWNQHAARNIAMWHAPEGWCVGTDMDHVIPRETAEAWSGAHMRTIVSIVSAAPNIPAS